MTLHSPLRNREVLLSYTTLNMGERSCGTGCSNDAVMEKVDEEGRIIGFSILKVSALKGQPPLAVTLKTHGKGARLD